MGDGVSDPIALDNKTLFPKLEFLRVKEPKIDVFDRMIKFAKHLKRVELIQYQPILSDDMVRKILTQQNSLQYIRVAADASRAIELFNEIEQGLIEAEKNDREHMKVHIILRKCSYGGARLIWNYLKIGMSQINDKLQQWKGLDYAISCQVKWNFNREESNIPDKMFEMAASFEQFQSINVNAWRHKTKNRITMTITNKDCKLNGYT